ncbi:hypothetical protein [Streptomyces flavidovirens]|uniref:hypothetical protein n=1 Tax=Streptomyces flavidovirens TaxID=67298 RepID=UPI0012FE8A6C|nr:hypothetical protein [Streptomyces flavidovirens]
MLAAEHTSGSTSGIPDARSNGISFSMNRGNVCADSEASVSSHPVVVGQRRAIRSRAIMHPCAVALTLSS